MVLGLTNDLSHSNETVPDTEFGTALNRNLHGLRLIRFPGGNLARRSLLYAVGFLLATWLGTYSTVANAQDVPPCPPSIDGSANTNCPSSTPAPPPADDSSYGPRSGACPGVPTSFSTSTTVSTQSALAAAYAAASPGDAIVVQNGTYSWSGIALK